MTSDEHSEYFRRIYDLQNHDGKISFETLMHNLNADIKNQYALEIKEKSNALNYVKRLHDKKIPMCVATLSSVELAESVLTRLGFMQYLKFIITGDDVGRSKKFPDIYLAAAKKLGCSPHETAVFEDCPTAIQTAYNAGFIVCGVAEPNQDHSEVHSHCRLLINHFSEML